MQKAFKIGNSFKKTTQKAADGPTAVIQKTEKTPIAENRSLAIRIAAVVAAFVLLVMGPVKLKGLKNEARNVFRNGTDEKFVVSVYNDIRSAADNAETLAGIAEIELGAKDEDAKRIRALAGEIRSTEDEKKLLSAFASLKSATENLYTRFLNANPSENNQKDARGCYKNIKSAFETVGNDAYFAYARKFNDARSGFPARLMALVGGIGALPMTAE